MEEKDYQIITNYSKGSGIHTKFSFKGLVNTRIYSKVKKMTIIFLTIKSSLNMIYFWYLLLLCQPTFRVRRCYSRFPSPHSSIMAEHNIETRSCGVSVKERQEWMFNTLVAVELPWAFKKCRLLTLNVNWSLSVSDQVFIDSR